MNAPDGLLYSTEHEWILNKNDVATLGITDHAQKELGDVVFVDLPEVGATFDANEAFGSVESVKAVSEVYLPVSGEVVETNESLLDAPEKINDHPYGEGWIIRIRLGDPSQLEALMSSQEYSKYVEEESQG